MLIKHIKTKSVLSARLTPSAIDILEETPNKASAIGTIAKIGTMLNIHSSGRISSPTQALLTFFEVSGSILGSLPSAVVFWRRLTNSA